MLSNKSFEVLREDIAATPEDLDAVFIAGFGFSGSRGR
jgi:hypothetical protein